MNWKICILIAVSSATALILLIKQLTIKIESSIIMLYLFIFTSVLFGLSAMFKKNSMHIDLSSLILILVASICSYLTNYFWTESLKVAPNVGYVSALFELKIIPIVILSIFLFNSEFSLYKCFGIFLCLIGGSLLSYN